MLFESVLSVATVVGGCEWPINDKAVCTDIAFWQFSNNPPNSASVPDATTFIIMMYSTCAGLFSGGIDCVDVLDFIPRKQYPPALLHASGSGMYDAS